ncbi:inosine guanosine and [Mollisia scopiformis]|uniref:Purine nucleoside phosphorylase n=1 Tax=Mollisia scopiformis TaxID=149040 RepID=A0A194XI23_MOLSC|nr:inosine guanosine and [Mollisia scopiformis]KUJ19786.1 inosine guanosine and [Mollisia scopiformis]
MVTTTITLDLIEQGVAYIESILPNGFAPKVGIIGGSGMCGLQGAFHGGTREISYETMREAIGDFPVTTVLGHPGKFLFGHIGVTKTPAVLMCGRTHYYESHELQIATLPIRILGLLGVETLIITNAAGGLSSELKVGDIVLVNDHINFPGLAGSNPLRGPNIGALGPRFLPLADPYDFALGRVAHRAWKDLKRDDWKLKLLHEGVYGFVAGPSYETRAECRMLASNGVTMVGMSTVPEVIIAAHCGIRVLAMSLISNVSVMEPGPRGDDPDFVARSNEELGRFMNKDKANHDEVLEAAHGYVDKIKNLIVKIIEIEMTR